MWLVALTLHHFPYAFQAISSSRRPDADWTSSGWEANAAWSREKGPQAPSSLGEDGWDVEGDFGTPKSAPTPSAPPAGTRLASEYDWGSTTATETPDPFFSIASTQKPTADGQVMR